MSTVERREGVTIGQPPKYLGYEDDLYRVLGIAESLVLLEEYAVFQNLKVTHDRRNIT